MKEFSKTFYQALGIENYDPENAIRLYTKELIEIDSSNFVAWNNRGVCKVKLAIKKNDLTYIESAKDDFDKAIKIANETDGKGFFSAEKNIDWAETKGEEIRSRI